MVETNHEVVSDKIFFKSHLTLMFCSVEVFFILFDERPCWDNDCFRQRLYCIIIRTVDFSDTVVYSRSIMTAVDVSKKHFIVLQYICYDC